MTQLYSPFYFLAQAECFLNAKWHSDVDVNFTNSGMVKDFSPISPEVENFRSRKRYQKEEPEETAISTIYKWGFVVLYTEAINIKKS